MGWVWLLMSHRWCHVLASSVHTLPYCLNIAVLCCTRQRFYEKPRWWRSLKSEAPLACNVNAQLTTAMGTSTAAQRALARCMFHPTAVMPETFDAAQAPADGGATSKHLPGSRRACGECSACCLRWLACHQSSAHCGGGVSRLSVS